MRYEIILKGNKVPVIVFIIPVTLELNNNSVNGLQQLKMSSLGVIDI